MRINNYCIDIFKYNRYKTIEVHIGNLSLGADNPIAPQSMTTTDTNDTEGSVKQAKTIAQAGAKLVRLTAQGIKEAKNLKNISEDLKSSGYQVPLVADIHFNSKAAFIAAENIEKVRINPGNFADGAKKFAHTDYTDEEYKVEVESIKEKFIPLLNICKQNKTALRIGTNHGSLSDRIMSRYGDTPEGMVESCLEYLRICKQENFSDVVLSIKASNARIMIFTVRLLVQRMKQENMFFPLHLGVTEAGEGEDGRIRSAIGIGALLADGLGDTIRVSLTEAPENEIPVAKQIINNALERENHQTIPITDTIHYSPFEYKKRTSHAILNIGSNAKPVVLSSLNNGEGMPDFIIKNNGNKNCFVPPSDIIENVELPLLKANDFDTKTYNSAHFVELCYSDLRKDDILNKLKESKNTVVVLYAETKNIMAEMRAAFLYLQNNKITNPVIISFEKEGIFCDDDKIKAAQELGPLFIDGFGDGIWIKATNEEIEGICNNTAFAILQAAGVRMEKPDYISCPGCGRTLYNLQETTAMIKEKTKHLKGVKIAVMGCIVNGPGEMADADYGYVGSAPGKITLYKQRNVVKKNIKEENAVDELIKLINESEN